MDAGIMLRTSVSLHEGCSSQLTDSRKYLKRAVQISHCYPMTRPMLFLSQVPQFLSSGSQNTNRLERTLGCCVMLFMKSWSFLDKKILRHLRTGRKGPTVWQNLQIVQKDRPSGVLNSFPQQACQICKDRSSNSPSSMLFSRDVFQLRMVLITTWWCLHPPVVERQS